MPAGQHKGHKRPPDRVIENLKKVGVGTRFKPGQHTGAKHPQWKGGKYRKYGLTEERYQEMLEAQGGVCAICQKPPKTIRLSVDHDHRTGRVRGLLCYCCNYGLGWFSDKPERVKRLVAYVESKEDWRCL